MHREPNVGLDPGSPGSRPGPKAGTKPLRHPGIPVFLNFKVLVESSICLGAIKSSLEFQIPTLCHILQSSREKKLLNS